MALAAAEAKTLVDITAARAEYKAAAEAEMAIVRAEADEAIVVARAEAEKATEAEFGTGFFQGYSDLKRRVALNHPE